MISAFILTLPFFFIIIYSFYFFFIGQKSSPILLRLGLNTSWYSDFSFSSYVSSSSSYSSFLHQDLLIRNHLHLFYNRSSSDFVHSRPSSFFDIFGSPLSVPSSFHSRRSFIFTYKRPSAIDNSLNYDRLTTNYNNLHNNYILQVQKYNIKLLLSLFRFSFELRKSLTFLNNSLFLFSSSLSKKSLSSKFSLIPLFRPFTRNICLRLFQKDFNPFFISPSSHLSFLSFSSSSSFSSLWINLKRFSFSLEKSYWISRKFGRNFIIHNKNILYLKTKLFGTHKNFTLPFSFSSSFQSSFPSLPSNFIQTRRISSSSSYKSLFYFWTLISLSSSSFSSDFVHSTSSPIIFLSYYFYLFKIKFFTLNLWKYFLSLFSLSSHRFYKFFILNYFIKPLNYHLYSKFDKFSFFHFFFNSSNGGSPTNHSSSPFSFFSFHSFGSFPFLTFPKFFFPSFLPFTGSSFFPYNNLNCSPFSFHSFPFFFSSRFLSFFSFFSWFFRFSSYFLSFSSGYIHFSSSSGPSFKSSFSSLPLFRLAFSKLSTYVQVNLSSSIPSDASIDSNDIFFYKSIFSSRSSYFLDSHNLDSSSSFLSPFKSFPRPSSFSFDSLSLLRSSIFFSLFYFRLLIKDLFFDFSPSFFSSKNLCGPFSFSSSFPFRLIFTASFSFFSSSLYSSSGSPSFLFLPPISVIKSFPYFSSLPSIKNIPNSLSLSHSFFFSSFSLNSSFSSPILPISFLGFFPLSKYPSFGPLPSSSLSFLSSLRSTSQYSKISFPSSSLSFFFPSSFSFVIRYHYSKTFTASTLLDSLSRFLIAFIKKNKGSKNKFQQLKNISYKLLSSFCSSSSSPFIGLAFPFSGRVYGAKKSSSFKMLFGSVPFSTLSSSIDYSSSTQKTRNGTWGFRLWLHFKQKKYPSFLSSSSSFFFP